MMLIIHVLLMALILVLTVTLKKRKNCKEREQRLFVGGEAKMMLIRLA